MKVRYIADDGTFWDTAEEALAREEALKGKPRYKHNHCTQCVFVGRYEQYDYWYCARAKRITVRFADDGYYSDAPDAVNDRPTVFNRGKDLAIEYLSKRVDELTEETRKQKRELIYCHENHS
jgi:hypothetical protein